MSQSKGIINTLEKTVAKLNLKNNSRYCSMINNGSTSPIKVNDKFRSEEMKSERFIFKTQNVQPDKMNGNRSEKKRI